MALVPSPFGESPCYYLLDNVQGLYLGGGHHRRHLVECLMQSNPHVCLQYDW